jgi:hypothetical protein
MIPSSKQAVPAATEAKPSRRVSNRHRKKRSAPRRDTPAIRNRQSSAPRRGSKTAKILAVLKRPSGASLRQLQKATGWQPHSVRGFLSGTLKTKMGLPIHSAKLADGTRAYRVSSK